jgi:hypothetical protein
MKPKYEIGTVLVELTRRCNMECRHCMRGPAENAGMKPSVMRALMAKLRGIPVSTVALGGGENTLAPGKVAALADMMSEHGVSPGTFCIVTNGKAMPRAFAEAVAKINSMAETYVAASFDDCHDNVSADEFMKRADMLSKVTAEADRFRQGVAVSYRYGGAYDYREGTPVAHKHERCRVLRMGRGATDFGGYAPVVVEPYDVRDDGDDYLPLCEDDFYVDVNGDVWPNCDLSYRFMRRRRKYCLGNVTDPRFDWYDAAVRFNLKFRREFPLALVEPGEENFPVNPPYGCGDTFKRSRREKIAATIEIAKEMTRR